MGSISQHPVLSHQWFQLADSFKHLTRLTQLEMRMPSNPKVLETKGRNPDCDGTLWDQEHHENTIRILVEEAKVNLCLRMLHDYKMFQYNDAERVQAIEEAKRMYDMSEGQIETKCNQFEESLGQLLWRAFKHVETLQLMDIPLLLEHCANVLSMAPKGDPPKWTSQESLGLQYFMCVLKNAEELQNEEILARSKEHGLIHKAVDHILTYRYALEFVVGVADGFAALCSNEDFLCNWQEYFDCDEQKDNFKQLEERLAGSIIKELPGKKSDLRPLLDFCSRRLR